ncbi:MAG: alginate lyase family protein [bacterium]|nr:alginate lyase family protein [bacterium]
MSDGPEPKGRGVTRRDAIKILGAMASAMPALPTAPLVAAQSGKPDGNPNAPTASANESSSTTPPAPPDAAYPAGRPHPFLFLTASDVERARMNMKKDATLAAAARELLDIAQSGKPADLPPLEREWWEIAKKKSWGDIYPEVNKHTGQVPRQWAGLAVACARASLLYPDAGMDRKARDIMLALAQYTFEFDHYDTGLNYATWGVECLEAYDILYGGFTPGERLRLDAFFTRMADAIIRNDELWIRDQPGGELNNHYLWHKLGRLMYGLFYGRPQLVREALHGPKSVVDCMRYGFTDDGLWMEASLNYQSVATSPIVTMARLLENAGAAEMNLWQLKTDDGRTLRQAYDALAGILFPDSTLPNIGDCYGRRVKPGSMNDYNILFGRFRDPVYAWLLRQAGDRRRADLFFATRPMPEGRPPATPTTRLWPEHGYAMLRTHGGLDYWTGKGWTLFATYSNSSVHANRDKLSLMLFGEGRHWLVDCEARTKAAHAFSASVQGQLNRETLAHNALLVDGESQRSPGGRLDLVEFQDLPGLKRLSIGDVQGRLYEGVRQLRTTILLEDYVVDFYQVEAQKPHEYAWLTHVDGLPGEGLLDGRPAASWQPFQFRKDGPWKWLRGDDGADPCQAPLDAATPYSETFANPTPAGAGPERFRLDVLTDGPSEVVRCGFPRDDSSDPNIFPMRLVRRPSAAAAWFLALYRAGERAAASVKLSVTPGAMHRWELVIEREGRIAKHVAPMLSALR